MNDLKDLLDGVAPPPSAAVDPAADLARGRALLHRTRRRRVASVAGVGAAAAGLAVTVSLLPAPSPPARDTTPSSVQALGGLRLVAWTGEQPPGYRVAEVPEGWEVQGGSPFALTLARIGDPDRSPDSFVGKLVVMLQSSSFTGAPEGELVDVAGREGRFVVDGATQMLTFRIADGRWVVVQAPTVLGWDAARLARFASGVEVLGHAEPGVG